MYKSYSKTNSTNQFIKQFNSSSSSSSPWKQMDRSTIAPTNKTNDVLIHKDLTVNGSIHNPSDIKLKENIQKITPQELDLTHLLHPVKYNYKNDISKKDHFGLIAQEIQDIYPHLVKYNELSDYKTVNYIELIPVLIAKVNNLEKELFALQQQQQQQHQLQQQE